MAILDKTNIDFQFFSTGDPKVLVILDTSIWGPLENKISIIEITTPSSSKVITYTFEKNKTNIYNSSNLLLSPVGVYNDLPDGLYKITVKGSPDDFCKHRDILKTDKVKLDLYKLYLDLDLERGSCADNEVLEVIKKNKLLIEAAEAAVSVGKLKKGYFYLKTAIKNLKDYENCKECK